MIHAASPLRLLPLVLMLGLAACSASEPEPIRLPDTQAATLPLLGEGRTVGTTLYGGADLSALSPAGRELLRGAVGDGLRGFTYYVDWADLEPEPGRYTLEAFAQTLGALQRLGVQPLVNVTVGDIDDYNLPPELSDGAGGLAEGVALDDPAVVERFGRLLDRVVPLATERGVFLLGVGNEVDARLDGEHTGERDAYVRFAQAARERVHATAPQLAVGVTLTNRAVRERTATFRALRGAVDVVPFNHAPIRADFTVRDTGQVRADLREVVAAYGEGPVVVQELTCPSAASMGASEAWQRACFEHLFEEIAATPRVRFASVFTFQDFDAPTCAAVRQALFGDELGELPPDLAERLADYLCELGVVRPDGTPKPAWEAIRAAASG